MYGPGCEMSFPAKGFGENTLPAVSLEGEKWDRSL